MDEPEPTSQKRERHWMRALRPLVWWSVLVLFLFVYHTHQRLSEQTRINFTIDLEGKPVGYEASVTLDGRPVVKRRAGLTWPVIGLRISHPKAEPISSQSLHLVWRA